MLNYKSSFKNIIKVITTQELEKVILLAPSGERAKRNSCNFYPVAGHICLSLYSFMLVDSICFSSRTEHAHCAGTWGRYIMTSTYFPLYYINLQASKAISGMHHVLHSVSIPLPLLLQKETTLLMV